MSGIACLGVDQTQFSKRWGSVRPRLTENKGICLIHKELNRSWNRFNSIFGICSHKFLDSKIQLVTKTVGTAVSGVSNNYPQQNRIAINTNQIKMKDFHT